MLLTKSYSSSARTFFWQIQQKFCKGKHFFLSLNEDNYEFISFLGSETGQNIMKNNSLSIHMESWDIFYQNFNTNEHLYSFLLAQQDLSKQVIPKRISYHHSFEKYIKNYLPSFLMEESKKFDLFSNKKSKYLMLKLNDWIKLSGAEKMLIRHKSKAEDDVGLKKIEEKERVFDSSSTASKKKALTQY